MIQLFTLSEILSQSTEKFQNKLSSSIIFQNKRQVGAAKLDEGWIMENGLFLCRDWETLTNVREIKTKPLIVTAAQQFWKLITQFVLRGGQVGLVQPHQKSINLVQTFLCLFLFQSTIPSAALSAWLPPASEVARTVTTGCCIKGQIMLRHPCHETQTWWLTYSRDRIVYPG